MKFRCNPRAHTSNRGAFTLIELLVVIAIIALLAAILFPVFGRVRENSRRSACMSNLRQMSLAIHQYTQDNDERMVPQGGNNQNNTNGCTATNQPAAWSQRVYPYVKNTNVYVCPSAISRDFVAAASAACSPEHPYPAIARSYALNQRFGNPDAMPLSYVVDPSRKLMVVEAAKNPTAGAFTTYGTINWTPPYWVANGFAGHLHTANYLFVDGHVKSYRPTQTATPFNMWGGMDDLSPYSSACKVAMGTNLRRSINCDVPEPVIIDALRQLEEFYE